MSFNFKWPTFSEDFHKSAAQMLDSALNRGPKPKVIADDICVEELGMGTIPPELEILEIGDLGTDRFRGIFRLTYAGDAHLVLKTKVQANPLTKPNQPDIGLFPSSTASRGILFAAAPLIVPMHLRLSSVKLRAIVVLVVSKAKGITLVFKNDPLESVEVSSTFDSVAVIQKYLQQEIEGQLREMFREDLPGIIHRLSQKWLSGEVKHEKEQSKQRSEEQDPSPPTHDPDTSLTRSTSQPQLPTQSSPALDGTPRSNRGKARRRRESSASTADMARSPPSSPPKTRTGIRRPRMGTSASTPAIPVQTGFSFLASSFGSAFPDIENYDPTYGLRPDDLPTHSGFSGLGKLVQRASNGLKDLTLADVPEQPRAASQAASPPLSNDFAHDPNFEYSDVESDAMNDDESEDDRDSSLEHSDTNEANHNLDTSVDDVSDFEVEQDNGLADASIDYSRFGYPPASAAFSDTHELNRASSIIFDDDVATPGRRAKRALSSTRPVSELARGSSTRSARSTTSSTSRRKKMPEVVYETIPAVGGGVVTRPRVYHNASKVQAPELDSDEEDTARPSQYGGTPSTRTGATRFGSDFGSATMGAQSSRTNTIRGHNDSPRLDAYTAGDDSEDSLLDLPPESLHSSDRSRPSSSHGLPDSSATWSEPKRLDPPRRSASQQRLGRDDYSGSSTAPTSLQSQVWDSRSNLGPPQSISAESEESGYRFRKNKSATPSRSISQKTVDRAGFVGHEQAMPARRRPELRHSATSPPRRSASWKQSPPIGTYSNSPPTADMLSTSPFRNAEDGAVRGLYTASDSPAITQSSPQAPNVFHSAHVGTGNAHNPLSTHLSIDASAHFLDLVKSNHTFSPFTRNMEHFTVRSAPVTPGMSGSGSAVGSSGASGTGTGSGGSQPGASAKDNSESTPRPLARSFSQPRAIPQQHALPSHQHPQSISNEPVASSPARRRRTFQLGNSAKSSASPLPSPRSANDEPATSSVASSSSSTKGVQAGFKDMRRRSRPNSMGPPSEAARLSSLRYEAIRE